MGVVETRDRAIVESMYSNEINSRDMWVVETQTQHTPASCPEGMAVQLELLKEERSSGYGFV